MIFYDRDEKEKGEDDISYNMNVGILVYDMGEKGKSGNSVKYIFFTWEEGIATKPQSET